MIANRIMTRNTKVAKDYRLILRVNCNVTTNIFPKLSTEQEYICLNLLFVCFNIKNEAGLSSFS